MAHFARIRATGMWVGVVLTSEFEAFDAHLAKAINGDEGGTWAPTLPIVIGGAGLTFSGSTSVGGNLGIVGDLEVTGSVTLASVLAVTGDTTINGYTRLKGAAAITGMAYLDGSSTIGKTGFVDATTCTVYSAITQHGHTVFENSVALNVGAISEGSSSSGYVKKTYWGTNANASLNGAIRYHRFVYPLYLTLTADRTLGINYDGLIDGETIEIYNMSSSFKVSATVGVTNPVFFIVGPVATGAGSSYYPAMIVLIWSASTSRWEPAYVNRDETL